MSGDKGLYDAENAAFGNPYGMWQTFRKWLNYFMTTHELKPKDLFFIKKPNGEQVVVECINVVEALLSTSPVMHLDIKLMLELQASKKVDMKSYFAQIAAKLITEGYFDRDPRFKKGTIRMDGSLKN